MSSIRIELKREGEPLVFLPGDTIDFGESGVIVWFSEPEAEAVRIFMRTNAARVRSTIEFVKGKVCDDKNNAN